MVIDTSALVAILREEAETTRFVAAIGGARVRLCSAATVLETSLVLVSSTGTAASFRDVDDLLAHFRVEITPVTSDHVTVARDAFLQFGKGRHKGGLNFGDCLVYALAKLTGEPLLFKGDDFNQTDLPLDEASVHPKRRKAGPHD
jgi:ribonuclease VapC